MKYTVTKRFKTDSGKLCNVGEEIEIKDEKEASRYIRMLESITPVDASSTPASDSAAKATDNTVGTSDEKPARKKS